MKYWYKKFGSNKPKDLYAEKVYNQMGRHEEYLNEADESKGLIYFASDTEISKEIYSRYEQEQQRKENLQILKQALEELREVDFIGYELIVEFYFADKPVTYTEMAMKYGISRKVYTYKLKRHLKKLRAIFLSYKTG